MAKTKKRIIFTNDNYCEEHEYYKEQYGEEYSIEQYYEDVEINFYDEKENLDVEVDGCIVAFADLGLWYGRATGAKVFGTKVNSILNSFDCDYCTWYCDRYNVHGRLVHHDGTNKIVYRVAKDKETAERIANKIISGNMNYERFCRNTKSLKPYISKVYGF
jgi:hypothetical protein